MSNGGNCKFHDENIVNNRQPVSSYKNFPHGRCGLYCVDVRGCIAINPVHVRCITDVVINPLCYVSGLLSIMLHEGKSKPYESMLISAVGQIQSLANWIEKLQNNGNHSHIFQNTIEEERRICPRFTLHKLSATINGEVYQIADISLKGCFINSSAPYPCGTTINMEIGINGGIPVTAAVKHCSDKGIGVEFTHIDRNKEKEFLWYMADFFLKGSVAQTHRES